MSESAPKLNARLAAIAARPASAEIPPIGVSRRRDDRAEGRQKVYRFARLRFPSGAVISCIVLDFSRGGARVKFEEAAERLPEIVTLEFEASGVSKPARIAWERDQMAGLKFLDPSKRIFGSRPSPFRQAPQELRNLGLADA